VQGVGQFIEVPYSLFTRQHIKRLMRCRVFPRSHNAHYASNPSRARNVLISASPDDASGYQCNIVRMSSGLEEPEMRVVTSHEREIFEFLDSKAWF